MFYYTHDEIAELVKDLFPGVFVEQNLIEASPQFGLWLVEWTTGYELRKLTCSYLRTPLTGVPQDAAMTTHHFLNLTGGTPDASWITSDYTAVESAFDTFWSSLNAYYHTTTKLSEYLWRADGPAFRPFGTALSPTLRRTARSAAGTVTAQNMLPPQCAMTVTETTASKYTVEDVEGAGAQLRNRWGRFYMPAGSTATCVDGRLSSATQTALANGADTFYEACVTAGLIPVVYSPTTGHSWSVLEIHVDDIFDVIRSRRFTEPLSRNVRTITQP